MPNVGLELTTLRLRVPCSTNCASQQPKLSYNSFFFKFIYFERESKWGRGREREGERDSQAGSTLSVQSPMQGSNSQTVRP